MVDKTLIKIKIQFIQNENLLKRDFLQDSIKWSKLCFINLINVDYESEHAA